MNELKLKKKNNNSIRSSETQSKRFQTELLFEKVLDDQTGRIETENPIEQR